MEEIEKVEESTEVQDVEITEEVAEEQVDASTKKKSFK